MTNFLTRIGNEIDAKNIIETGKDSCTYKYWSVCNRCGGQGGSQAWSHTGYTCYKCRGTCGETVTAKGYTEEKLAKLNATKAKAEAKRVEKINAQQAVIAAAHKIKLDAFTLLNPEVVAYLNKVNVETANDFLLSLLNNLQTRGELTENQINAIQKNIKQDEEKEVRRQTSKALGQVGDKIEFTGTLKLFRQISAGDWNLAPSYLWKFTTDCGSEVTYIGSANLPCDIGTKLTIKATVKSIEQYLGTTQTRIQRPKVVVA